MPEFVAQLAPGPLDIIGDVHGEFDVLERLLGHLGYDHEGNSTEGRQLVFLGDLVDRGPDSPAVLEKVMRLVEHGKAQCLMGNHELNILLERPMHGNGWLIQPNIMEKPGEFHSKPANPQRLGAYLQFFASLPLALENESLRLVHACWNAASVNRLRNAQERGLTITELYEQYEADVREMLRDPDLAPRLEKELGFYSVSIFDPKWPAKLLPACATVDVIRQMNNPIRVLTTSEVTIATKPFFAMRRWHMTERTKWWDSYDEDIPVIIGHFWRRFNNAAERVSGVFGKDVFDGIPPHAWLGKRKNVYCVDYSVGQLHVERQVDPNTDIFHGKLAALRYPEWEVHHDDGSIVLLESGPVNGQP